ncbi:PRELI/MSF1 domain-containing protein [Mycena venus]|uniref:PRELI/MSF1 domain-containing protein n=1 Tax=Mycena venus TaxID=2733690 RepID=A0A8H7CL64_9AGAR|nr:PRELI/MSF1 domain-containing protein [Mycena venus]
MKFFSQSYSYDDPWSIVTLAFFLRYPNPYASHVLSCDVISRSVTPSGSLMTTRLILKRGAMPRWFPKGIVSRAESWVVEETEVDPVGRTVRCQTRNLDHVKVMQVQETVEFRSTPEGKTLQLTEARILSGFGWGLTRRIETHGLNKFKANLQRVRFHFMILSTFLTPVYSLVKAFLSSSSSCDNPDCSQWLLGSPQDTPVSVNLPAQPTIAEHKTSTGTDAEAYSTMPRAQNSWSRLKAWLRPPPRAD